MDIPDAATNTDVILFDLEQPLSVMLVDSNSVSLLRLTGDVFRLATLAIVPNGLLGNDPLAAESPSAR